jgi:hypothetical protein
MTLERILFTIVSLATLGFVAITWQEARQDRIRLETALATQQQIIDAAENREQSRDASLKITLAQIATTKKAAQTPAQILSALQQSLHLPKPITLDVESTPDYASNPGEGTGSSNKSIRVPDKDAAGLQRPAIESSITSGVDSTQNTSSAPALFRPSNSDLKSEILDFFSLKSQSPAISTSTPNANANHAAGVVNSTKDSYETATIPNADLKPLFDEIQDCQSCSAQLAAAEGDLADEKQRSESLTKERDAALSAAKGSNFWHRLRQNSKWLATGAAITLAITRAH